MTVAVDDSKAQLRRKNNIGFVHQYLTYIKNHNIYQQPEWFTIIHCNLVLMLEDGAWLIIIILLFLPFCRAILSLFLSFYSFISIWCLKFGHMLKLSRFQEIRHTHFELSFFLLDFFCKKFALALWKWQQRCIKIAIKTTYVKWTFFIWASMNVELWNTREAATRIGNVCRLVKQKENLRNFASDSFITTIVGSFIHSYSC